MITTKAMIEDIKVDIEEQVDGKVYLVGTNNIDQGNVNQEPQRVDEDQEQANIEDHIWLARRLNIW